MILSKDQLVYNISTEISDNSTGQISPYDVRHNLLDIIDSVHVLLEGKEISTENFGSLDVRTTRVGSKTIQNINLDGHISEDNSAFGYGALKSNYQGIKNTAIGSSSLSCNVYGEDNVAVGYNSLGANSNGFGNVGIGNYTLQRNKFGHFNIAIGHAAGYYVDKTTNNKLFIASHPVNNTYICDNPLGSGLTPLVYGDLDSGNLRLGIAVNSLHNDGTLQVSGAISPSEANLYDLGSSSYNWNNIYLSSGIVFPSGKVFYSYSVSGIAVQDNLIPSENDVYTLGTNENRWSVGYFDRLVSNEYVVSQTCKYVCKTLFLASSGACEESHPCGYLNDAQLEGAGFLIQSNNGGNLRDYYFTFEPYSSPDYFPCFENSNNVYSRHRWKSNISIHLDQDCHLKTDRIIGSGDLSLTTQTNCFGLFLKDGITYLSTENLLTPNPSGSNGYIAGVGSVNFFSASGSVNDYVVTYGGLESGVDISQRFLSRIKSRVKDPANNNRDKLSGFEIKYFDDYDLYYVGDELTDRLAISSFNNSSQAINSIILMKDNSEGVVGINNFNTGSEFLFPSTTLNVRSKDNSIIRATAETAGYVRSALQLLGENNCLLDGVELVYHSSSGISDINMYKDSGQVVFVRMLEDSKIGFFSSSGIMDDMITVGGSGYNQSVISIFETSGNVADTVNYGKVFVKQNIDNNQSQSLYFLDSSGNLFDLVHNKYDDVDGIIYTDNNRNTLAGIGCNSDRTILEEFSAFDNTALGFNALNSLASGDQNVVIGSYAANTLISGVSNVAIGYGAMKNCSSSISNNIVIGNSIGENLSTDDTLLIGNSNYPIISGDLRQNDRHIFIPQGGSLELQASDNTEGLVLKNNIIEVKDGGGDDYPQNQLSFKFTGNESADLLILKHSGVPFEETASYEFADSGIPYAELKGDLRLLNAIRFRDETSLYSAQPIFDLYVSGQQVSTLANSNKQKLDSLIIEGIAQQLIPIGSFDSASSGIIKTRENIDVFVSNRDQYLQINPRDFVIAIKIGQEYRPLWVSSESTASPCCVV